MDKTTIRSLLAFLAICYAVSFISGMITTPEIGTWYATLAKPSWQPPNWLFAPVWTLLYGLMAVAGWKVWCSAPSKLRTGAVCIFGVQLAVNFPWSPLFFSFHQLGLGFFVIVCLAILLLSFVRTRVHVSKMGNIAFRSLFSVGLFCHVTQFRSLEDERGLTN